MSRLITSGLGSSFLITSGLGSSVAPITMPFRHSLVSALKGNAGITAIVGTRIYPTKVPQSKGPDDGPWLLWTAKIKRLHDLDGVTGVATAEVKIGCGSTSLLECESLANAVYDHFDGNESALPGITQLETISEPEEDEYEAPVDNTDRGTYWIILTYTFRYVEATPAG